MSETKARPKHSAPVTTDGPAWLDAAEFSAAESKLYRDAAGVLALDVTYWARQVLNRTADAVLGRPRGDRHHRAPTGLGRALRKGGHARRRRPR